MHEYYLAIKFSQFGSEKVRENINTAFNGKVRPIPIPQPFNFFLWLFYHSSLTVLVKQIKHPFSQFVFVLLGSTLWIA